MNIDFKKDYIDWLYKSIDQFQVQENLYRITLPYLDRNNDCTEIYIRVNDDGNYHLTDDGETIGELELSNFDVFSSKRRKEILNSILNAHGVLLSKNKELYLDCTKDELPQKKHMLSQCMVKISDLFYTSKPNVQSLFIEDVQEFLDKNEVRYFADISFPGKSGLVTTYDFAIPKSKAFPERVLKVVNNIDQLQTNSILFLWDDTRSARASRGYDSKFFVFLHDKKKISNSILTSMRNYDVTPIIWSDRAKYVDQLTK